jgi:hypothetical protein
MQAELQHGIRVEIGAATQVAFQLSDAGKTETITVHCEARGVQDDRSV